ncbi:MAG: alkaline phosphatase [Emcibacteraceae bacterium]|jgi:alkaline phosphatase/streptomycin-6-phosphatase
MRKFLIATIGIFSIIGIFSLNFSAMTPPKNIILLIGDGMSEAEISATRNYEYDGGPGLFLDTIQEKASAIVISKRNDDANLLAFVGDSASGGTALATGILTSVRRISTTAQYGKPIKTIFEEAKEDGFKVGLVTTAVITDATPASFAAHVNNRYCMKGGDLPCLPGEKPIIDQMLELDVDVLLGGGHRLLTAVKENTTVEEFAILNGYEVAKNIQDFSKMGQSKKLLGVFSDYHLPYLWQAEDGRVAEKVTLSADGNVVFPIAQQCVLNPESKDIPTLEMMTKKALNNLSADNEKGFFLMAEGASIDKAAHDADICASMGAMLEFDRTVKIAIEYAKIHEDTVVIVTSDHGGSTQNIHHPYYENYKRTGENIPGLYELLTTKGGNEMAVYYGTNNTSDQVHTGIDVPIYSYGMPDDLVFKGTIRQTDIKGTMEKFLFE